MPALRYRVSALIISTHLFLLLGPAVSQTTENLRIIVTDTFDLARLSGASVVLSQGAQTMETLTTGEDGIAIFRVTVADVERVSDSSFRLAASFPNSDTGRSTTTVNLPRSGMLSAELFDALGQNVASQFAVLPAGPHNIEFDLSRLVRGTYVARVEFEGEVLSERSIEISTSRIGLPTLDFGASSIVSHKHMAGGKNDRPNVFEIKIILDGYVDKNYTIDVSQSQGFTAWMNKKPETVAVNGLVVAKTGNELVPLLAAYEDGTTFHILGKPSIQLPDQVIVTSPAGNHMSITLTRDGLPERMINDSSITYFGNYRDGLVDISIISPDGSTEFALDIDISQQLFFAKGNETNFTFGRGLSDTLQSVGFAVSVASCGLSIAETSISSRSAASFAIIPCGSPIFQATSLLLPTDNPALEATGAGLGAFRTSLGCSNPVEVHVQLSWIDCVAAAVLFAEAVSLSSDDAEASKQEAANYAKSVLGINVFETSINTIGMELVRIPAGTFQMGSNNGLVDERPVHFVTLSNDFWIGKYEVTQQEYRAVTDVSPSRFGGSDRLPVEQVTWFDAINFANSLSANEGISPCYDSNGGVVGGDIYRCSSYRLPTEAEWEYAARAGTTTEYSFGDDAYQLNTYAWYESNSGSRTHPVGKMRSNPWGLHDVHGNVWEWVHDWYSNNYYRGSPSLNPAGPNSGSKRIPRGGSWFVKTNNLRSATRVRDSPVFRDRNLGFRLARTAKGTATPTISIVQPSGGEKLYVGIPYTVKWTNTSSVSAVNIFYKFAESPSQWTGIASNVISFTGVINSYTWVVPNTPSTEVRILIVAADGTISNTRSALPFTIKSRTGMEYLH